ncbi:MAG: AAC(3) family N-acetyltransferase [Anaerolineae bacterium]|nr:AAC(3) family N-acetyltransferase [Anaerolineae bacterium]
MKNAQSQRMAADLQALGVRPGGVLLVHSSLRALGALDGGAETAVAGLLTALGPAGTLLMPALSYQHVTPQQPLFDVRATPSNVGALPEYFRTRPGTLRSLHPTHSVCGYGPLAAELLSRHGEDRTPCGPRSPFHLLPHYRGQILMLGCGLRPNTSMHAIEELVEPPYLFGGQLTYRLVDWHGHVSEATYRVHGFRGWAQRYDRVALVLAGPALRSGPVLAAQAYLLDAAALWSAALAALRRDPLFFVEPAVEEEVRC